MLKPLLTEDERHNAGGSVHPRTEYGCGELTLRDYFAAAALPQLISLCQLNDGEWNMPAAAAHAYMMADEMLAARKPVTS